MKGVPASIVKKKEKYKANYDRHRQSVPELKQGDNVYNRPSKLNTARAPGQIKSTLGCRSVTNNSETQHNRQYIHYFPKNDAARGSP